ncbi:MAG: polysaccharide biosynthesis/export protein [Bacteroidota bacterium]|nr:polysaccharide biosynthesis/export protein [Bacteroidota bacterium]
MKRIILCLFIIYSYSLFSQTKGLSSDTKDFFQQAKEQAVGKEQMLNKESFPVGNPVSPDFYIVGPGDVLTLQALPLFPVEQLLSVSPENKIIIPRIGDVDLSGKTLAAAYDTIAKIIRARIPDAIVSLALRQPRIVLVHIYGSVTTPGIFTLPASYRVSTAIKIANQYKISNETSIEQVPALLKIQDKIKQSETYYSETGLAQNSVYSERNIIIMQNNGVSITADFEKATILKQWEYDPYLKEGDEIFVPFESDNFPAISISGAVLRPTSIVYKNGDKASFLLKAGYGFKEDANLKDIVLFDPINDSKTILKVDKSMNLLSTDVDLSPGSMIIVGEQKPILPVKHGVVSVRGNVGSPGIYIIVPNKTRLKDAINMAGGFTQDAYLPLAKIIRRENLDLSPNDAKREVGQLFQYSDLTLEDTTRYNLHMELRNPIV